MKSKPPSWVWSKRRRVDQNRNHAGQRPNVSSQAMGATTSHFRKKGPVRFFRTKSRLTEKLIKNTDPLQKRPSNRILGKPRPGHRPDVHLPTAVNRPAIAEYLKFNQSPYITPASSGGLMPEYLPNNLSPFRFMQTPGLPPRTHEIDRY